MKKLILILMVAFALPILAQAKSLLNLDESGVAIQGYDPVAFFTDSKPSCRRNTMAPSTISPRRNIASSSKLIPQNTSLRSAVTAPMAFRETSWSRLM